MTELEYEAALAAGLSMHVFFPGYVLDAENGIEYDEAARAALEAFRQRLRHPASGCVPVECTTRADGRSGWQVFTESINELVVDRRIASMRELLANFIVAGHSANSHIKRHNRAVGIFPNAAAIIRLVGAVLLEQHEHWQLQGHRMVSAESMSLLPDLESLPAWQTASA